MPGSLFDPTCCCVGSGDPAKADWVEGLIAVGGTISVQALSEITNVARRKVGCHGRPKICRTGSCSMIGRASPIRFVLRDAAVSRGGF